MKKNHNGNLEVRKLDHIPVKALPSGNVKFLMRKLLYTQTIIADA
jgi:hypothetical protein